jgi:hypothetical protein
LIRNLLIGLWCGAVALGATYGGAWWQQRRSQPTPAAEAHNAKPEVRKVKPISVPVISDGVLQGYVSVEFNFVYDKGDPHGGGGDVDPESFVTDEAFRLIYTDTKINFSRLEKVDVEALTKQITTNVNARLGSDKVKETLIKNLTFVPKEDIPR